MKEMGLHVPADRPGASPSSLDLASASKTERAAESALLFPTTKGIPRLGLQCLSGVFMTFALLLFAPVCNRVSLWLRLSLRTVARSTRSKMTA